MGRPHDWNGWDLAAPQSCSVRRPLVSMTATELTLFRLCVFPPSSPPLLPRLLREDTNVTSANFSYPHPFYHCDLSVPLSRSGQPSSPKCWRHISIPPFRRTDRNVTSRRKTIDLTPPQITTLLSPNQIMMGLMSSFVFLAYYL